MTVGGVATALPIVRHCDSDQVAHIQPTNTADASSDSAIAEM